MNQKPYRGRWRLPAWQNKRIGSYLVLPVLVFLLPSCSTAGNGKLKASITNEATVLTISLGANVKDGLAMDIEMERDEFGVSRIKVSGAGKGEIDREPGHKATVEMTDKVSGRIIDGAKMGFAP